MKTHCYKIVTMKQETNPVLKSVYNQTSNAFKNNTFLIKTDRGDLACLLLLFNEGSRANMSVSLFSQR